MGQLENSATGRRAIADPVAILTPPVAPPPPPATDDVAEDLRQAEAAKLAAANQEKKIEVRFVKNINPREQITFKDGTKFRFPAQLYRCTDPEQAAKIKEVADYYGIVLQ